jgi:hypothetical protein
VIKTDDILRSAATPANEGLFPLLRIGEKINEAAFKQLIRAAVAANSAARAQRAAKNSKS